MSQLTSPPWSEQGPSEPGGPGGWPPQDWPPRPEPPSRPPRSVFSSVVAAIAVVALIAYGASYVSQHRVTIAVPTNNTPSAVSSAIGATVDPWIVDITTTLGYQGGKAAGTGIVLTADGEILTNHHVVQGSTAVSVTDVGNARTYNGTVVGYDANEDVAVVKLAGASGLKTAKVGDSSKLNVGDGVLAVGNAGGVGGTPSESAGAVTALNRQIVASDPDGASEQLTGLVQTSASLQPGDSGGPLVDGAGAVVGVDTAGSSRFSFRNPTGRQGFAVPINKALSIAHQITSGQASSSVHIGPSAFLGVEVQPPDPRFGLGSGSGAAIAGVIQGTPASRLGLAAGDTITAVGGRSIGSPTDLSDTLRQRHPGDRVSLTWTDDGGDSHTATVQLANGPVA